MKQDDHVLEIRKILKQRNVKITLSRIFVFQILYRAKTGLSAYDIEAQLLAMNNRINLATIYSTLKLYHSLGLVQRYKVDFNHAIYLFNSPSEFIRIECNRCGYTNFLNNLDIDNKIQQLCKQSDIKSTSYSLTILAESCEQCQNVKF